MKVITLVTKKSVREILKEKKFLKYFTLKDFQIGDMFEMIAGNKKSLAIILKIESAMDLKQEIRKGEIEMKKLILSKTGDLAGGKIIDKFKIEEIKSFLKNPEEAQKNGNEVLKKFFPKKKKEKRILASPKSSKKGTAEISSLLSFDKVINRPKTYNSEMQELVDEIRTYFNEKAVFGRSSFSYYIGFFKRIPLNEVRQMFGEVKLTKKSTFDKKKLF